ncbi:GyrI-like domain-containing protein [Winogradskyella sp. KYW1333]|uniref:GyrI-like domain-containing protein n=1 Tax=Winogradskyella sp. KYW1333 TaxID=2282123 RepID=UPI000DF201B2|nr:GyrI-like domain-containing protein [Winogradskyella sp. KYW1333]RCT54213.1 AraC family transcriptional regulator [Winogradskyella sp. KYW1333]
MNPTIKTIGEKHLIGMRGSMHHGEMHKIIALWKQFMPNKFKVTNTLNEELIALQNYKDFSNTKLAFDIWACAEVSDLNNIPEGLSGLTIPAGEYAVFVLKGMDAGALYREILSEWLPNSGYKVDSRPHFQVMGKKYINNSDKSEEDVYLPIKSKL